MRKILGDGTILRTRISHGSGEIGDPGLWKHIWHEQLGLDDEAEFWRVIETRRPARRRDEPPAPPPGPSIPAWVVAGLVREGVPETAIRDLDAVEAEARLRALWARQQT